MEDLHKDLDEQLAGKEVLDPAYRRKKLITYVIRTLLSIALYWYFWDVSWVPFTLWFYVPLNLVGLALIWLMPILLERKIKRTRAAIDRANEMIAEHEEMEGEDEEWEDEEESDPKES